MKKRLRKKLHKGEFQELGFKLNFTIGADLDPTTRDQVIDDFIYEAVEANNLSFGGGGKDNKWDGFITKLKKGSATEEDQKAVGKWLESNAAVEEYIMGELVDAWHAD